MDDEQIRRDVAAQMLGGHVNMDRVILSEDGFGLEIYTLTPRVSSRWPWSFSNCQAASSESVSRRFMGCWRQRWTWRATSIGST